VVCDTTDELWQSPLHWAAKGNSLSVVAKLLQASHLKPSFIDIAPKDGLTPLIVALVNGETHVADLLVGEGASCAIQVQDQPGWQWLIRQGDTRSAQYLLEWLNTMFAAENPSTQAALKIKVDVLPWCFWRV
jgi:ankyrin repeat protein